VFPLADIVPAPDAGLSAHVTPVLLVFETVAANDRAAFVAHHGYRFDHFIVQLP
jgi:hypothetical protein